MNKYAIPYSFYCVDDNEPGAQIPFIEVIQAETPEEALEILKTQLRKADLEQGYEDLDEDLPGIWYAQDDEPDDDNIWIIGEIREIS